MAVPGCDVQLSHIQPLSRRIFLSRLETCYDYVPFLHCYILIYDSAVICKSRSTLQQNITQSIFTLEVSAQPFLHQRSLSVSQKGSLFTSVV